MPCNFHLRALAAQVKEGIREAGGTPMEFNTIAISDGITMGTEGMKASLVSREVIADSIELVVARPPVRRGDRAVGLRQDDPGHGDGAGAARHPAVMLYGGSIAPGRFQGHDVTIQDVFEAIGAHAAGQMTDEELAELEDVASPGRRRLRRPVHRQHDGDGLRDARHLADRRLADAGPGRRRSPRSPATRASSSMDVLRRGVSARATIITAPALENAIAAVAATGGSTNAVLHLLAIAREAGVELDIDDFDRISERTPLLCDLKPGGALRRRRPLPRRRRPAGRPAAARRPACCTRTRRRSPARRSARSPPSAVETPGQDVVRPLRRPAQADRRPGDPHAATSPPRAASSRSPATSAATTAGRPASSTARRTRWRPCTHGQIAPATWS